MLTTSGPVAEPCEAAQKGGHLIAIQPITEPVANAAFPLLSGLGLGEEEFAALARQGFIHGEQRGGKKIFRLRFRIDGRQRVRYVSPRHVAVLEVELKDLQRGIRSRRRLNRIAALARAGFSSGDWCWPPCWRHTVLTFTDIGFAAAGERPGMERFFLHAINKKENVMEPLRTDPQALQDQDLNQALEMDEEELDGLSLQQRLLARIQEYEEEALARIDPLAAVVGMGTVYLAQLFEYFAKAVVDEFKTQPPTLALCRELTPQVLLLAKLRSAIDTDFEFQQHNIGEQTVALRRATSNGPLAKQTAHHQSRLVPPPAAERMILESYRSALNGKQLAG